MKAFRFILKYFRIINRCVLLVYGFQQSPTEKILPVFKGHVSIRHLIASKIQFVGNDFADVHIGELRRAAYLPGFLMSLGI